MNKFFLTWLLATHMTGGTYMNFFLFKHGTLEERKQANKYRTQAVVSYDRVYDKAITDTPRALELYDEIIVL